MKLDKNITIALDRNDKGSILKCKKGHLTKVSYYDLVPCVLVWNLNKGYITLVKQLIHTSLCSFISKLIPWSYLLIYKPFSDT